MLKHPAKIVLILLALGLLAGGFTLACKLATGLIRSSAAESGGRGEIKDEIVRGWLPEWFPPEAQGIIHEHDQDTNHGVTYFKFMAGALDELLKTRCERNADPGAVPNFYHKKKEWKPTEITEGIKAGRMKAYSCSGGKDNKYQWVLVINNTKPISEGYLWIK